MSDLHFAHIRRDRPLLERARAICGAVSIEPSPLQDAVDELFAGADIEA